jgi:glycosyltransferase involved in cell wall biosynthesis
VHVAYVTPRYGREVLGGAELGVRMFAERLVASLGWTVDVLTTCARDLRTWANELPEGERVEDGVRVHRFANARGRAPGFDTAWRSLLAAPARASRADALAWVRDQGPGSPALLDAVASSPADVVVFYPYLYEPTVLGVARAPGPVVMHPAAHDEPPIRLPVFADVFHAADGFVFQTYAEARFVNRLFTVGARPQVVLGLGSDPAPGDAADARAATGVGDRPYLLYVGRVDDGKGTGVLARMFEAYKGAQPGPLALVLAGPVVHRPAPHPDVVVTGPVDEPTKWGLLRGATAFVNPSGYEAFSLVLVEAWHAGLPVLVNARCAPTVEHCERSGGGVAFGDYEEFAAAVTRLVGDEPARRALGAAGRAYVETEFAWPAIVGRYQVFLESVCARVTAASAR